MAACLWLWAAALPWTGLSLMDRASGWILGQQALQGVWELETFVERGGSTLSLVLALEELGIMTTAPMIRPGEEVEMTERKKISPMVMTGGPTTSGQGFRWTDMDNYSPLQDPWPEWMILRGAQWSSVSNDLYLSEWLLFYCYYIGPWSSIHSGWRDLRNRCKSQKQGMFL